MKTFNLLSVIVGTIFSVCATFIVEFALLAICTQPGNAGEVFYRSLSPLFSFISLLATTLICYLAGTIPLLIAEGHFKHSFYIGCFSALSAAFFILTIPYPLWYKMMYLSVFIPFTCIGYAVTKKLFALHFP